MEGGAMRSSIPTSTRSSSTLSSRILKRPQRYAFESVICRGRTGTLYRAHDEERDEEIVLKLLHPGMIDSAEARERFERSAATLTDLDHPNIVDVYDHGYHHGIAYLAMDRADGVTLDTYLTERGPLPFDQFAPLAVSLLAGLSEAHEHGIIHGDLQASHIMLESADGAICGAALNGFGFPARDAKMQHTPSERIRDAKAIGAVAPERILGHEADHRIDLYAFGILAYRMLSGDSPFRDDEELAELYQHVHDQPPLLSESIPDYQELPRTAVEFVHRLLAKNPKDRPRDADQAIDWLRSTVKQSSIFDLDDRRVPALENPRANHSSQQVNVTEARPDWSRERGNASFPSVFEGDGGRIFGGLSNWRTVDWLAAGLAGLAVAGGLWLFANNASNFFAAPDNSSTTTASSETVDRPTTRHDSGPETARIERVLARTDEALTEGEYGAAKSLLESIEPELEAHPKLLAEAASYSTRARVGRTLEKAKRADNQLDIDSAIEAYRDVLTLESSNRAARERLDKLTSSVVVSIASDVEGEVYIDDKLIGTTPLEKLVPVDFTTISVRHRGYDEWKTRPNAQGGTKLELSAELKAPTDTESPQLPSPKSTDDDSTPDLEDDSLMEMDIP